MLARILPTTVLLLAVVVAYAEEPARTVVFRAADGKFLNVTTDGTVAPAVLYPVASARFELIRLTGDHVALKAADGRFLVPEHPGTRRLRAVSLSSAPGDPESFLLVPGEGNLVALWAHGRPQWVLFQRTSTSALEGFPTDGPRPEETVAVYRFGEIPDAIQTALGDAIKTVIDRELGDQEYYKVRTENTERYITLPAPTLSNLGRKKRHQVLGVDEEFHVRARLAGRPDICIAHMSILTGYRDPCSSLILFAVDANLPIQGRVSYKVPKLLSVTTGYHTTVALRIVGQIEIRAADAQISLSPPELLQAGVAMHRLDLSNDILQTVRRPIERTINGELRKNNARIRAEANRELREAVGGQEFRHPLLRFLTPS